MAAPSNTMNEIRQDCYTAETPTQTRVSHVPQPFRALYKTAQLMHSAAYKSCIHLVGFSAVWTIKGN